MALSYSLIATLFSYARLYKNNREQAGARAWRAGSRAIRVELLVSCSGPSRPQVRGSRKICWLILSKQHGELCSSHGARRTGADYHSSKWLEHREITQVIWSTLDVTTKLRNNMGSTNHGFGYDFALS